MDYSIYKLDFQTGVHFGTGMLNESSCTFCADQLFSALYIEALKMDRANEFYEAVKKGNLLFSDAFPYLGSRYMVPKPMLYVEPENRGESGQKKLHKKIKFLPIEKVTDFLQGEMEITEDPLKEYGHFYQQTMAQVRTEEDTLPYRVGTYYYRENCGLYVITAHKSATEKELAEELLDALSYTGIGGKKSVGLGKFVLKYGKVPAVFEEHLKKKEGAKLLLSVALPQEAELEHALAGASYQLDKRSGFVASDEYADEWKKKKDLYVFGAGSCFTHSFEGDIYDVSDGGNHPVYRYAKPLFMGV